MNPRILIITNGPLARNPRVIKEATALAAANFEVTVLGVQNHRPSLPIDSALTASGKFKHVTVDLLGTGQDAPSRMTAWSRRLQVRLWRDIAHKLGLPTIHGLGPANSLLRTARKHPADLTITHNEIAHWTGLRLAEEGRLVAADIEDWHSEDLLPADRKGRPLAALQIQERRLLRESAYISTTSHALCDALHQKFQGQRPICIPNAFPLETIPAICSNSSLPQFFWFSQTMGPGRGLREFVAGWRMTRLPSRLVLVGQASTDFERALLHDLSPTQRNRVCLLPPVPPSALPALIAQHDIGLALEQGEIPNRNLTITNKILQYLVGGLAVVATPTAGQREVLAQSPEAGCFIELNQPQAVAERLDQVLGSPEKLLLARRAARNLASEVYCWERVAPQLVEKVSSVVSRHSS